MEVVDRGSVVVLLSVGQWLLRVVREVRHVLFILVVRVESFMCHGILVRSMDAAMVVGAIVEVLVIVVHIMVSVLHLVVRVVMLRVVVHRDVFWLVQVVLIDGQIVVDAVVTLVVVGIDVLNVVIVVVLFVVDGGVVDGLLRWSVLLLGGFLLLGGSLLVSSGLGVGVTVVAVAVVVVSGTDQGLRVVVALIVVVHVVGGVDSLVAAVVLNWLFVIVVMARMVFRACVVAATIDGVLAPLTTVAVFRVVVAISVMGGPVNMGIVVAVTHLVMVALTMVDGHLLDLIVVVFIVVGVAPADLLRVGMVVSALDDDVVLLRLRHGEVQRLVLLVLVVVGIVLVAVDVLRSHVMVGRILIVVRRVLGILVALVILVSPGVIAFVGGLLHVSVRAGNVATLVRLLSLVVRGSLVVLDGLVVDGSSVVDNRCFVVDRRGMMGSDGLVVN